MLIQLNVKNFALIDHLELFFDRGFTILTGETGAGKSILIDSINYVLGEKFSKDFIRTGEDRTYVEAIFTLEDHAKKLLDTYGIEYEDKIIFFRESYANGRNNARINGKSVLINVMKEVGKELLDIHGQHNNQNLLDSSKHMDYLDSFIDLSALNEFLAYQEEYKNLGLLKEKLANLLGKSDREKLLDYLKFQLEDIEKAKLRETEEIELTEKFSMINNSEKISTGLTTTHELLSNEENGILEHLSFAIKSLKGIEKVYDKVKGSVENMEGAFYSLEETFRELTDDMESVYYDQDELNEINERLYLYSSYKKKYGPEVQDVLDYYEKIKIEYEEIINAEELIEATRKAIADSKAKLRILGKALHKKRMDGGRILSKKINDELKFVGLEKADFEVQVSETENIYSTGIDEVNFMISTNKGEPKKPLEKIVSGGELSRIMLSMKVAFIDKDKTPSVIFDEIDTGISGRIAEAVGEKMYSLSKGFQVFCVTHLPQIAAFSDNHLVVEKMEDKNRTFTKVGKADKKEKIEELAKMIGGSAISLVTIKNAEDIVQKTQDIKNKYRV